LLVFVHKKGDSMNRTKKILALNLRIPTRLVLAVCFGLVAGQVGLAQDLTGGWNILVHEDFPERIPGPDIMEYVGLPINDAARNIALAWDPALLAQPEFQCRPHPSDYGDRFSHARFWNELDQDTQLVTAIQSRREWQSPERTIFMDGRQRPSVSSQHTWQGFSLGDWDGNMLNIHTTHLKHAYLRRNGVPRSDQAEHQEHIVVHEEHMTIIAVIRDPLYLDEPFVRSTNYRFNPQFRIDPYPCDPAVEIERARGFVPHYLPGQNPFYGEYAERYGISVEATLGGVNTMYPD